MCMWKLGAKKGDFHFKLWPVWVAKNRQQMVIKGSTQYLRDKQDFEVSSESPSSKSTNVEILFIAWLVSSSFDTFADFH